MCGEMGKETGGEERSWSDFVEGEENRHLQHSVGFLGNKRKVNMQLDFS